MKLFERLEKYHIATKFRSEKTCGFIYFPDLDGLDVHLYLGFFLTVSLPLPLERLFIVFW